MKDIDPDSEAEAHSLRGYGVEANAFVILLLNAR
jgi:hypothetical protein